MYDNEREEFACTVKHSDEDTAQFRGRPMLDQTEYRAALIREELQTAGQWRDFDAVVGRGGLLPPLASGTYAVNNAMLEALKLARRGEHASNLGGWLASGVAKQFGVKAYIVDPVSVDEWEDVARISGTAAIDRTCLCHALNMKAVAKRYAREVGKSYESSRLIVVHMGSGISVSAHRDGRMVDNNTGQEGPMAADRSGSVPVQELIKLCFSGKHTHKEVDRMVFGDGGFYSYLGTKDLMEVERRIDAGGPRAKAIFDAMVYQIAKEIGAMAAVLKGNVDGVLFTGGMAHSERVVAQLREYVEWIAPVKVYPGEDELEALSQGVLRVLRGEEREREFELAMEAASV